MFLRRHDQPYSAPPPAVRTPGQIAYEAYAAAVNRTVDWETVGAKARTGWNAAAQAILDRVKQLAPPASKVEFVELPAILVDPYGEHVWEEALTVNFYVAGIATVAYSTEGEAEIRMLNGDVYYVPSPSYANAIRNVLTGRVPGY